jgi:hypothetical protein
LHGRSSTEFKKILLQLATNYEESRSGFVSRRGENPDEDSWLTRTLAVLRSEGSLVDFESRKCAGFTASQL